jgi:hypothetical protein
MSIIAEFTIPSAEFVFGDVFTENTARMPRGLTSGRKRVDARHKPRSQADPLPNV